MVDEQRGGGVRESERERKRRYNLWNEHWTLALHRIMHLRYARLDIDIIGI